MARRLQRIGIGLGTAQELVVAMWRGPFWWMVPVLAILLPVALLLILLQITPAVAPFVYTVF